MDAGGLKLGSTLGMIGFLPGHTIQSPEVPGHRQFVWETQLGAVHPFNTPANLCCALLCAWCAVSFSVTYQMQ